jgi:dihydrofolate reductase
MRNIVVLEFITLDGVIQGGGGPEEDTSGGFKYGGWCVPYSDEAVGNVMAEQMAGPFALLLGRKTFDIFASYWPQHADNWPGINEATKFVVSNTLGEHEWSNSVFINGDAVEELRKLKAGDGPPLQVYGSANLVQTLLKHDLVDELWLKIYPITLGEGKRLFQDGTSAAAFTLESTTTSPSGVIVANYRRAGEVKTESF